MIKICQRQCSIMKIVLSGSKGNPGIQYYDKNGKLNEKYRELASKEYKESFSGHLGKYKYYDRDAMIASALKISE